MDAIVMMIMKIINLTSVIFIGSRLAKKKLDDDFHRCNKEDENDNDDENDDQ